jgi:hypothetical protein
VTLLLLPTITLALSSTVGDKVASQSYNERSTANTDSYHVFFNSYGFGVGLGSDRASSFVPTLLGATGVIGSALFVAAVAVLLRRGWRVPTYRPVVWALVALLVGKISSGPDLSDGTGILWISLGILAHAALTAERSPTGDGRDGEQGRDSSGQRVVQPGGGVLADSGREATVSAQAGQLLGP